MHKLDTMTSMPEFTGSMALSLLENLIRLKKKKNVQKHFVPSSHPLTSDI